MPDAEHQKEVVQGFQPDDDECDIDITIKFHDVVCLGTQWFGRDPYKLDRGDFLNPQEIHANPVRFDHICGFARGELVLWHQFWTCPSGGPAEWSQSRSLGVIQLPIVAAAGGNMG